MTTRAKRRRLVRDRLVQEHVRMTPACQRCGSRYGPREVHECPVPEGRVLLVVSRCKGCADQIVGLCSESPEALWRVFRDLTGLEAT